MNELNLMIIINLRAKKADNPRLGLKRSRFVV
jgi:hypothetical protein